MKYWLWLALYIALYTKQWIYNSLASYFSQSASSETQPQLYFVCPLKTFYNFFYLFLFPDQHSYLTRGRQWIRLLAAACTPSCCAVQRYLYRSALSYNLLHKLCTIYQARTSTVQANVQWRSLPKSIQIPCPINITYLNTYKCCFIVCDDT